MRNFFLFVTFLVLISRLAAQNSGDSVFDTDILHEVRLTFDQPNYWAMMVENFESNFDGVVPYIMANVEVDGVVVDSIGVRFKGFTSYTYESDKKPIKLDFNEFVPGKRLDGLRKLNLNNSFGDASVQRDAICYNIMRSLGVKAPRTAHTRVYINDEYWGLYLLVEQVDKEFVQNNFTNNDGNLYKNKGWSHFEWNGPNHNAYHPPFELKTNEDEPDWAGFVNLMNVLNNGSDADIADAFSTIFNIDLYLKVLAVDVATNNWDSYLEHGRNWYIYEDDVTGMFHWIPWDYNFALGGTFSFDSGDECEIFPNFYEVRDGSTTIQFYEDAFAFGDLSFFWNFGDGETSDKANPVHMYAEHGIYTVCVDFIQDEDCIETLCKDVNTNDSQSDCSVLQDGSCPHPFGSTFVQTLNINPTCCNNWSEDCEEIYSWFSGDEGGFEFSIDQSSNTGVLINRLLKDPKVKERYYTVFCDLMNHVMTSDHLFPIIDHNYNLIDASVQEDPNFLFSYSSFAEISGSEDGSLKELLSDRIDDLQEELVALHTCPEADDYVDAGDIVINEFLASNSEATKISDTDGEYDDWIELFNNSDETVNLSGLYLSDDDTAPLKWKLPYGTQLRAEEYLIIWADQDSIQFGLHANFKLPKAGGKIVLSNSDGTTIDEVTYPEQTTNIAYARIPNGVGDFVEQQATHAYNNEVVSKTEDLESLAARVFPNPVDSELTIEVEGRVSSIRVLIRTIDGRLLLDRVVLGSQTSIDVSGLSGGTYFLEIVDELGRRKQDKIVVVR